MNTKLTPIEPTSTDLATAHARRIVKAIADMAEAVTASYADHPAAPAKTAFDPATKQPRTVPARPGCAKTDIQSRLGDANRQLVETILAALTPPSTVATASPAPVPGYESQGSVVAT